VPASVVLATWLLAALPASATRSAAAAPGIDPAAALLGQVEAPPLRVDVPERVEVRYGDQRAAAPTRSNERIYLVIGLSTAAVIGLLLLVVLLARGGNTSGREVVSHPHGIEHP
jgi:hypothetical protein